MIGALYNGISGLSAFQQALNTESNNISNVNTAGYKADSVTFADMMYQQGVGKGASLQSVQKSFTQGNLKVTGNPYDMAIDGKGFFMVKGDKEEVYYTRAGDFRMGTDGTLQTPKGLNVMGFPISAVSAVTSDPAITQFTSAYDKYLGSQVVIEDSEVLTFNARATDYNSSATADDITVMSGNGYKAAGSKIADIEALATEYRQKLSELAPVLSAGTPSVAQVSTVDYNNFATQLTGGSDYVELYINNNIYRQNFDTDAQTTMNKLSDKISAIKGLTSSVDTNGLLTVTSLIPGQKVVIANPKINNNNYLVNNVTEAVRGSGLAAVDSVKVALQTAVERAGAEFLELTNRVDLSNTAALQVDKIQLKLDNLGISTNGFGTPEVVNGVVLMNQGDHSYVLGKISTAYFTDVHSLKPLGENLYGKTFASGEPIEAGALGKVQNTILEMSNAELGTSLTNLMVYQRAFEANSKAITTSDEFLNVAIQLKK
ncbi:MAG: flagellar hook-basal body complex protein [Arcobacteraceae bacterium]